MARRKKRKLNRKVVIVFAVIGVLLLGIGVGAIYRFRDRIWPPDPAVCARLGDEALVKGDIAEAVTQYKRAVGGARGQAKSEYLVKLSELALGWLATTPADQSAQRRERYGLFLQALEEAKRQSPEYLKPRQRLVEHWFNVIVRQSAGDRPYTQFLEEADNLLKLDPADHLTMQRRAIVYALKAEANADDLISGEKAMADFRGSVAMKKDSAEYRSRYVSFLQFQFARQRITPDKIIEAYEDAYRAIPNNPEFYVGLGNFKYRTLGKDEKLKEKYRPQAMQLFQAAIEKCPESAGGYLAKADLLVNEGVAWKQKGQPEQAAAAYEKALAVLADARKNTQELHRVCHAQAIVYEQQGQFAKGIDEYRRAIAELQRRSASQPAEPVAEPSTTQPGSRPAVRPLSPEMVKGMLAEMYYRLGHALLNDAGRKDEAERQPLIVEARKSLASMRELTKDATSVNLEVRLATLDKKYDQAFKMLEDTYQTNKNVLSFQNKLLFADLCMSRNIPNKAQDILYKDLPTPTETEPAIQVLLLKARCRSMFNDVAAANSLVEEALKLDPGNKLAIEMRRQLDTGKDRREAMTKWRAGQRDDAIRDMQRILQRKPEDAQAIRDLASMYDAVGKRSDLMALLLDAVKRLPNDQTIKMAYEVYKEADPAKRKEAYFRQLQTITDPFERNIRLAEYSSMNNQPDQTVEYLEQAYAVKPKDVTVVGQLFVTELRRRKFDKARSWAKVLSGLDSEAGQAALGELAMVLRDPDAAIEAFTKVLAVNKNAKEVLVYRGRCYLNKEKPDLAEKDFRAAWDLDNRYLEAAIGLARAAGMKKDETGMTKWVQTANALPEGIRDKWVRDMTLMAMEKRKDTTVQSLIQNRESIVAVAPEDADNRIRLSDLYVRANEPAKAEAQLAMVYANSKEERVRAAGKLAELYVNTRRPEKAKGILNELQQKAEDRLGAMLVYADYLLRIDGATADCQKMIEAAIQIDPKDARGYLEMGKFYVISQQWDKAVAAMDKVLSMGVKGVPGISEEDVRVSQIECLVHARLLDRAAKGIEAMRAKDKDSEAAALLQAMLYQEQGEIDKAMLVLTESLKVHKDSEALFRTRGALHLRRGELQEAKADLIKAREFDPNDIAVGMTLARVYERLRLRGEARAEYVAVMSRNPTHRPAYERLLQLYLQEQDWAKFNYLLEQARQSFPDDPTVLMQEGQMWMQRKDPEKGLARMKEASDLVRGNEAAVLGVYLANLATTGRFAEMLATTDSRVTGPLQNKPPAWLLAARGLALAKLNRPAEADAAFVQAVKVSVPGESAYILQRARDAFGDAAVMAKAKIWGQAVPKNWDWQLEQGNLYSLQARQAPAGPAREEMIRKTVEEITKALDMTDDANVKADINFVLGTFLQLADKPQEAQQAYLRVLKTLPQHLQANNNMSILCADELNQPKKALEYAETIMKYYEVDANVLDTYGWALARNGEYEKAYSVLTRAKTQDPESADARYHLGWTLEKLQKNPDARAEYKHGLDILGPGKNEKLRGLLQAGLQRVQ